MSDEKKEPIILPEKYYHTYFIDLVAFVQKTSDHLLSEDDHAFIEAFNNLSEDAQCLFLRLSNRRGYFFRQDKISYDEFNVKKGFKELLDTKFISDTFPPDLRLLNLFTKSELVNLFPEVKELKKLKKEELQITLSSIEVLQLIRSSYDIIRVEKQEDLEFLKMLYFGHYRGRMTDFVVRDVGHITIEKLDEKQFKPWFQGRSEADELHHISRLSSLVRGALKTFYPSEIIEDLLTIDFKNDFQSELAVKSKDRLLLHLGMELEREQEWLSALHFYEQTDKPPSKERRIRIHNLLEDFPKAEALAKEVLINYQNATERVFAKDFLDKPKKRINRSTTKREAKANELSLQPDPKLKVEELVLNHFIELGYQGIHGENFVWRNLFGLVFWDEIFDQSHGKFHNHLQRSSSDFYSSSFYQSRSDQLNKKIKSLSSRDSLLKLTQKCCDEKWGVANPMIYWFDELPSVIGKMIELVPFKALKDVLLEMAKNPKENSTGFPDIFVWKDKDYHFHEVKSPNDHLSSKQLFWLDFMQERKIKTEILKISYK